jgi:hypothetical protein
MKTRREKSLQEKMSQTSPFVRLPSSRPSTSDSRTPPSSPTSPLILSSFAGVGNDGTHEDEAAYFEVVQQ